MKNLVAFCLLGSALSLSAQKSTPTVEFKTNPIGLCYGNYSFFVEAPATPHVSINMGIWIWDSKIFKLNGAGASVGVRRYLNEDFIGTFFGLYARGYRNDVFQEGVRAAGFVIGRKEHFGEYARFEYYAGYGKSTGISTLEFAWGVNVGIIPTRIKH